MPGGIVWYDLQQNPWEPSLFVNSKAMRLNNDDFIAGAVAAACGGLEVDAVASGSYDAFSYHWHRIYDPDSDECMVVLMGDPTENPDTVSSRELCQPGDKAGFTRAFLKTVQFGGNEELAHFLFIILILDEGWVDAKWLDAKLLKDVLEKGAAELGQEFDFNAWAKQHGFSSKSKRKRKH